MARARRTRSTGYELKIKTRDGLNLAMKGGASEELAFGLYMLPMIAENTSPEQPPAAQALYAAARAYLAACKARKAELDAKAAEGAT